MSTIASFRRRFLFAAALSGGIVAWAPVTAQQVDAASGVAPQSAPRLVGAWRLEVQNADGTPSGFEVFQTFHQGGTMTETSNLFATLTEGPGSGAWRRNADGTYDATFQLYAFENGQAIGVIRVRESLRLVNNRRLVGDSRAELILPDGEIILLGDNPLAGDRVPVVPLD